MGGRIDRSIYREREEVRPSSVIHLVCVCAFIRLLLLRGGKRERKKIKDEKTTDQKMLGRNKESQKDGVCAFT